MLLVNFGSFLITFAIVLGIYAVTNKLFYQKSFKTTFTCPVYPIVAAYWSIWCVLDLSFFFGLVVTVIAYLLGEHMWDRYLEIKNNK